MPANQEWEGKEITVKKSVANCNEVAKVSAKKPVEKCVVSKVTVNDEISLSEECPEVCSKSVKSLCNSVVTCTCNCREAIGCLCVHHCKSKTSCAVSCESGL